MMRTLVFSIIVMALLGAAPVVAQSGDEAAVAQAVEAFRNAMLKADRSQFEALTADQLSYGHSSGRIENKAEFIDRQSLTTARPATAAESGARICWTRSGSLVCTSIIPTESPISRKFCASCIGITT